MTKRYCVLGGGGSFGLHTSKYLLDHADPVSVLAIGRAPPKLECFTLGVGDGDARYSYRACHITYEFDLLMEILDRQQPQVIINFAAQGEGATSLKNSWRYFETNCVALARLAEALISRSWLERFIHIGTSELYGSVDHAATEDSPIRPTSPYAASKAAFDLHLISIHRHLKFPMNIIRPSNAYGPGQQLHRLIPKAVLCGLTGCKLDLHGGGRAEKSYIHSRDLARAIHLVSEGAPLGTVYNAGPPAATPVRHVVASIAAALGIPFEQICTESEDRQHQDGRYWLDSSAIKRDVGWAPQINLREARVEMVAWGRKYLDQIRDLPTEFEMRA